MKFVAVLVLALVCTYAVESDVFAELKESEFGSTLVDTIQIQLATSDNIDHVVSMVRDVRGDLRARQGEIKAAHDEIADSCRADMDAFTRKMDHSENVLVKNQRLYDIDYPVFVSRSEEKVNKEAELADRVATAESMQDEEDFANAAHEDVVAEFRQVQQVMHTARAIMSELEGDSTAEFLQVKTSAYSKLSSHIRAFTPLKEQGISHGYAQIFNVLASIAERAPVQSDAGMVATIMRIFDDIEENLEASLAIERTANAQRQESYAELEGRIDREIDSLEAKIADLGRVMLQLQFACAAYNSNVEAATQSLADDQTLADDRSAACNAEDNQYAADNARVSSQITVAGNAIYLLDNKRDLLERFRA